MLPHRSSKHCINRLLGCLLLFCSGGFSRMATGAINRRQFLRGDFRGQHHALRPPWALNERAFMDACTRCGKCVAACPQEILVQKRAGYPQVDFQLGECDFCSACVGSCEPGALFFTPDAAPWNAKASITDACLARHGIFCIACLEHCESRAIRRQLTAHSASPPEITIVKCNGCGACYRSCPVNAIAIKRTNSACLGERWSSTETIA